MGIEKWRMKTNDDNVCYSLVCGMYLFGCISIVQREQLEQCERLKIYDELMYFNRFRISTKFKSLEAVRSRRTPLSRAHNMCPCRRLHSYSHKVHSQFAFMNTIFCSDFCSRARTETASEIAYMRTHMSSGEWPRRYFCRFCIFCFWIRMCDKSPPIKSHFLFFFSLIAHGLIPFEIHFISLSISSSLSLSLSIFAPRLCVREWAENINTLRGHLSLSMQWAVRHIQDKKKTPRRNWHEANRTHSVCIRITRVACTRDGNWQGATVKLVSPDSASVVSNDNTDGNTPDRNSIAHISAIFWFSSSQIFISGGWSWIYQLNYSYTSDKNPWQRSEEKKWEEWRSAQKECDDRRWKKTVGAKQHVRCKCCTESEETILYFSGSTLL